MKRPNKKDYYLIDGVEASLKGGYYMDLEKYADELERNNLKLADAVFNASVILEYTSTVTRSRKEWTERLLNYERK